MKVLFVISLLSLGYAIAAVANPRDILKSVPAKQLAGINITSCIENPIRYRVSCGHSGKCSVSITEKSYICRGTRD
jgi:hypothetical protein